MKKQLVKRLLAGTLAVMMMASLAACGGEDQTQGGAADSGQNQEAPAEGGQDQEAPAEGGSQEQGDTGAPAAKPTAVSEIEINKAGTDATKY